MDSVSVFIIVMMVAMMGFTLYYGYTGVRHYFRSRGGVKINAPKLRGRAVLIDPKFGSALVVGYMPIGVGLEKAELTLMGRDGQVFHQVYGKDELIPDNELHAIAGAREAVWRVKGKFYDDRNLSSEIIKLEKKGIEMAKEIEEQKVQGRIDINEAATMAENIMAIVKELKEPPKTEGIKVLK